MVTSFRSPVQRIAGLLGIPRAAAAPAAASREAERRRSRPYRCAGCQQWGSQFVFMSNGCNYCVPCARNLALMYRYRPAGRRADDITTLEEAEAEPPGASVVRGRFAADVNAEAPR